MKIEWNKVTWYSKLVAVVLFIITFCVGFDLGKEAARITPNSLLSQSSVVAKPINTVSYSCSGKKTIIAAFYQGESKQATSPDQPPIPGGSVLLKLSDGRSMTIPQTISADGERYANSNESFVFWGKGNGAFITENNLNNVTYNNCVVTSQTVKP